MRSLLVASILQTYGTGRRPATGEVLGDSLLRRTLAGAFTGAKAAADI